MSVWFLDIQALDGADVPVTLRFSSGAYIDASEHYYEPRLNQPALFTSSANCPWLPAVSAKSGYGEAVLANLDGGLNYLADYAVDGRAATLSLKLDDGTVMQTLSGTVQRLTFSAKEVSVRLRDLQELLDSPHPQNVYGGTNVLPAGVDGTANDIKGKVRPRVYGKVRNAEPVLVNSVRYIYEVHDGTGVTVSAVYDRGVGITKGADYPDAATMQSTAPTAGQFRCFGGYFRLGAVPSGQITFDADSTTALLGDVFSLIAIMAGATVNASDVSAMNAVGEVGIYLNAQRNTSAMLDLLASSAGGYWAYEASGTIRLKQLLAPASPTMTLMPYQVVSVDRKAFGAGSNGLPIWRVLMKGDRVEVVQSDVAAGTSDAQRARVAQQLREAVTEAATVLTRHPLSEEKAIETALRSMTDAATQSARLGALLGARRDLVSATVRLDSVSMAALSIGLVLTLTTTARLGYSSGRAMTVLGYLLDARRKRATLILWG